MRKEVDRVVALVGEDRPVAFALELPQAERTSAAAITATYSRILFWSWRFEQSMNAPYAAGSPVRCWSMSPSEAARSPRLRQFACEHVDPLDVRRARQKIVCLVHERGRDLSGEVRLAPALVWEGVEDRKARGSRPHREPRSRLGLLFGERQRALEQAGESILLPRFCLQRDQQSYRSAWMRSTDFLTCTGARRLRGGRRAVDGGPRRGGA